MKNKLLSIWNQLFSNNDSSPRPSKTKSQSTTGSATKEKKLPMNINIGSQLGFSILKRAVSESIDSNHLVSPVSLTLALALLNEGTTKNSKKEIESFLEADEYTDRFDVTTSELAQNISKKMLNPNSVNTISIANGMFVSNVSSPSSSYIERAKELFQATVEGLDFGSSEAEKTINNWVKENTRGKITAIIDKTNPNDRCYLLNAIYLLCTWAKPFEERSTVQEKFELLDGTEIKVQKMKKVTKYNYYESKDCQLVELPYKKNEFSMLILLPRSNDKFKNVIDKVDKKEFLNMLDKMKSKKVRLSLPKFKIEYTNSLNEHLKSLGFKHIFKSTKSTDEGHVENLFVSQIIQKTFVDVDEKGTEAAAVTAIHEVASAPPGEKPPPIINMNVERPFLFAIKHSSTNGLLFLGSVANPLK